MALWHWIVGGAAAYFFKDRIASSVCAGQPVPASPETAAIQSYMASVGVTDSLVLLDAAKGGYCLKKADGTLTQGFNTLAELLAHLQATHQAAAVPATVTPPPATPPVSGFGRR